MSFNLVNLKLKETLYLSNKDKVTTPFNKTHIFKLLQILW